MTGIPRRGPGILEVKLGWAYRSSLPDDCEQWRPYAIGSYEGTQESTEALTVYAEKKSVSWVAWHQPFRFEVSGSPSPDLTISLFARPLREESESQVISLGSITLNPLQFNSELQKVDIQDGTGRMEIQASYTQKEPCSLEAREVWDIRGENDAGLICVKKKDTGRFYGMETIYIDGGSTGVDRESLQATIAHPFIAALKFASNDKSQLKLLSPLSSGGYLFDHLQRERRFDANKARFYAAELVCILESLHDRNTLLGSLEAENILLDSVGHVNLCKPSIYGLKLTSENGDCVCPGTSQYPPPETLRDDKKVSRAGDWWALGTILYEMLTGSPPFYHKSGTERQRKVVNEELRLPESMPSTARHILAGLLHKDPIRRLGANGALEIKAHPFFEDMNWDECAPTNYATPFKPHNNTECFQGKLQLGKRSEASENEFRIMEGEVYEQLGNDDWPLWIPRGQVVDKNAPVSIETRENEEWELVKDPSDDELYFRDRLTGERVLARHESSMRTRTGLVSPSKGKEEAALAAALEAGYHRKVFSQILGYGVDLNVHILDYDETINRKTPDGIEYKPDILNLIPVTPLEWAVEHRRIDLVNLFLDNGADANYTVAPRYGPALLKAVKRKSKELIEVFVPKTNRLSSTRALGWAVELGDITSATTLLAHGVRCEFEESDRPAPPHPWFHDYDSLIYRTLEAPDLTPPLVRAARIGNASMVSLLLSHGADPNTSYHDLGGRLAKGTGTRDSLVPVSFPCGRAVYLAKEMGHTEVVRLLVDAGADINLKHQTWLVLGHTCKPVPRSVYLEVRAGLEAVAAERTAGGLR
ncbi:hypothetical protein BDW74DRAFT_187688 [Aspergillus multicolor]|uniref:putative protein kinase n=1 Tax=Aspergillus multicolor TaxID=41759 RepID=UPI003CCCB75B